MGDTPRCKYGTSVDSCDVRRYQSAGGMPLYTVYIGPHSHYRNLFCVNARLFQAILQTSCLEQAILLVQNKEITCFEQAMQ